MTKILFFTAGAVPTAGEKTAIANLEKLVIPPFEIGVRNGLVPPLYGAGAEACDMVAGTPPLTGDGEAYEDKPVFDPADAAEGFATVTDNMALTGVAPTGSYTNTVTFTVVDGAITAITLS